LHERSYHVPDRFLNTKIEVAQTSGYNLCPLRVGKQNLCIGAAWKNKYIWQFDLKSIYSNGCYHHNLVFCLTTGSKPPPKRFLHIGRSRASSFKWEYPLPFLRSSSSFLYIYISYRTANLQMLQFIYLFNKYTYWIF
jgi:hypothetical protein